MWKSLPVASILACGGALLVAGSIHSGNAPSETGDLTTRADCPECPLTQEQQFVCPADPADLLPVDSIEVTVRAGRLARGQGHLRVPARPGSGEKEVFEAPEQERHLAPDLQVSEDGLWVRLYVEGHPGRGENVGPPDTPFDREIWLKRCTDHEGNLVRIHVDSPDQAPWKSGKPLTPWFSKNSITVTAIYDQLLSVSALIEREYSCIRCGRVQVCGVPDCP